MSSNTIIPSQFGYTAPGSTNGSQVFLGRDISVAFEAVGLGADGRPDRLKALKIFISNDDESQLSIKIDMDDVLTLLESNPNINQDINLKLKQVSVCEINDVTGESEEKAMIILGSQTFSVS